MAVRKDEKRKTWYYYGKRKLMDGTYKYYKKRGFQTKREAVQAEQIYLMSFSSANIKLNELVTIVDKISGKRLKQTTMKTRKSTYDCEILPYLGDKYLKDISVMDIEKWLGLLKNMNLKASSINTAKGILSVYLNQAVRLGYLQSNPCMLVHNVKNNTIAKKRNFWELNEFQQFISCVDDEFCKDAFTFLYGTGLRRGEFLALQWKDVDFENEQIRITKTLNFKSRESYTFTTPKTKNSIRNIDLQKSLMDILNKRYDHAKKLDGFNQAYFIFGDIRPCTINKLRYNLKHYIRKSDVPKISIHGLRHSHATYLIQTGKIDDQLIADRLGHTVQMLRSTYAHIYRKQRNDIKSVLDDISKK